MGVSTLLLECMQRQCASEPTFFSDIQHVSASCSCLKVPEVGKIYSFNEGNYQLWDEPTKAYMDSLKDPSKWGGKPYSARYIGSLVSAKLMLFPMHSLSAATPGTWLPSYPADFTKHLLCPLLHQPTCQLSCSPGWRLPPHPVVWRHLWLPR